jgi:hypothetical protein
MIGRLHRPYGGGQPDNVAKRLTRAVAGARNEKGRQLRRPQTKVVARAKATSNRVVEEYITGRNGFGSSMPFNARFVNWFRLDCAAN